MSPKLNFFYHKEGAWPCGGLHERKAQGEQKTGWKCFFFFFMINLTALKSAYAGHHLFRWSGRIHAVDSCIFCWYEWCELAYRLGGFGWKHLTTKCRDGLTFTVKEKERHRSVLGDSGEQLTLRKKSLMPSSLL